jgi:hypothetical protein
VHLIAHLLGVDSVSSNYYAFWSGFGGDIPIVGAVAFWLHHHNCNTVGCWRLGHARSDGTTICRVHGVKQELEDHIAAAAQQDIPL